MNTIMSQKKKVNDHVAIMSDDLNRSEHITANVSFSKRWLAGFYRPSKMRGKTSDGKLLLLSFQEYSCMITSLFIVDEIANLEVVQRFFIFHMDTEKSKLGKTKH